MQGNLDSACSQPLHQFIVIHGCNVHSSTESSCVLGRLIGILGTTVHGDGESGAAGTNSSYDTHGTPTQCIIPKDCIAMLRD